MTKDGVLGLALRVLEINLQLFEKIKPYKGQEEMLLETVELTKQSVKKIQKALELPEQEPVDSMGMPLSCGMPLCSPDDHHPLCKLASTAAPPASPSQIPVYKSIEHDEDWLEKMYSMFCVERNKLGKENMRFKAFMRAYGKKCANETLQAAQPTHEPKPVAFLAKATRFKIIDCQINHIPLELEGRWVAFVAAENGCHLKLNTPTAAPPRQWVGLTDEERECIVMTTHYQFGYKFGFIQDDIQLYKMMSQFIEAKLEEKNT